jgi:ring-1,2-phenylacetyl-CoA epoxidase subunit PaaC
LWQFTDEMFEGDTSDYQAPWEGTVMPVLAEARLSIPEASPSQTGGRHGIHGEQLASLLAEMQWMQRTYPGLNW